MRNLILLTVFIGVLVGIAWAGCKLDYSCYHSCAFNHGNWSPHKDMECRKMCTYCQPD